MAELVTDCPRCGANHVTFDILSESVIGFKYNWQSWYETFCICRHCKRSTVFILSEVNPDAHRFLSQNKISQLNNVINQLIGIESYISISDMNSAPAPEHLPANINDAFTEGAKCFAIGCYNAAASMFRLCLDIATNELLPAEDINKLNAKIRRSLGLRLIWLLDNNLLPEAMRELSTCIKEDGNDGAHEGTLQKNDAEDILDFTSALLERLYTEPERLRLAKERREQRRAPQA